MSKTHFQLALSFSSTVLSSASGDIVLISDISFWLNYILAISDSTTYPVMYLNELTVKIIYSLLFIHSTKRKNYNSKIILINLDKNYLEKYFAFIVRTLISK